MKADVSDALSRMERRCEDPAWCYAVIEAWSGKAFVEPVEVPRETVPQQES